MAFTLQIPKTIKTLREKAIGLPGNLSQATEELSLRPNMIGAQTTLLSAQGGLKRVIPENELQKRQQMSVRPGQVSSHDERLSSTLPPNPVRSLKRKRYFPEGVDAISTRQVHFENSEEENKRNDISHELIATPPYEIGRACGELLYSIPSLVAQHLEQEDDHRNNPPQLSNATTALLDAGEFTVAIDAYIHYIRLTDGCSGRFPLGTLKGSNNRKARLRWLDRSIYLVEAAYKNTIRNGLGDVFRQWAAEQTMAFNKGVDYGLKGAAWRVYPEENVALIAGLFDWGIWLRMRCEELGMFEAEAGRRVLDDPRFPFTR